ncbi:hypothetical protein C0995_001409 [Termitomyces sp. Mi166|nr:hypothetical protein C0995_001409 [Termitomyces sp. Mi166\
MTKAYLAWCNETTLTSLPQPTPTPSLTGSSHVSEPASTSDPPPPMPDILGTIPAIDLYTLVDSVNIHQTDHTSIAVALIQAGFIGNSLIYPSLAVSIKTLELFHVICLHRSSFSIKAFAKTLSYLYHSNYFLPTDFVDKYADEVKAWPSANTEEDEGREMETVEGDPTDGETSPGLSTCTNNWKAVAKEENKKMWAIFAESGIFASACHHGFILWICDMIMSGELAKYGLAVTAKALEIFKQFLLGYDIGCTFETTIKNSSLGPDFKHWDNEKYANLANMLYQNYQQALKIIETNTLDIQHILELHNIDEVALGIYITDERNFFFTLEKESNDDLHAIAYVELLQELWSIEAQLADASARFRMQTPANYHFVVPDQTYTINFSQTHKTNTTCRQLNDHRETLLVEILDMEQHMNIDLRWTVNHSKYQKMAEYIANLKYEKALDHLQTLVIKRLFELHKLNLSQTGYQMHMHIAKSLQT